MNFFFFSPSLQPNQEKCVFISLCLANKFVMHEGINMFDAGEMLQKFIQRFPTNLMGQARYRVQKVKSTAQLFRMRKKNEKHSFD